MLLSPLLEPLQLVDVRAESGIEFVHDSGDPENASS
jgi:hypothetical protein